MYHFSPVQLFVTLWIVAGQDLCPWDFPSKNTGMGCHILLQEIFPTQEKNFMSLASSALAGEFFTTSISWRRRQWHPTPVLLPGESHGWRSLEDCSPWGHEDLDTTERLPFHFSLSCIGEGNGNPLQCSCLENPRDGEAWWAAIYGVAQSRTRLKRLSSSSISWEAPSIL